jgi:ABC-2 type transport system permease protein
VSAPGTIIWFAQHDARLAWRDMVAMMTAGGRWRSRTVAIALVVFVGFMHLLALSMVGRFAALAADADRAVLVVVTSVVLLGFSLMASQAMESATRIFYARGDIDLILSSPAATEKLFAVRMATMAIAIIAMATLLAAPFVNVLAAAGGARWLGAYGVVVAIGAAAATLALTIVFWLFRTIGPKRARLVAQIVAAVIGAAVVIGLQIGAILSYGTMSRIAILHSDAFVALAPEPDSIVWLPARALLGDTGALAIALGASFMLLGAAIAIFAPCFADLAIAAGAATQSGTGALPATACFRRRSAKSTLRRKEWMLLWRDPWLVSQTLMQLLYLVPPAVLLWRNFADDSGALLLLVPVLVMAAGQLAGGLAWLAISGEDAPDLMASAPVAAGTIVRAKIEAVMGGIAIVFAPFLAAIAFSSPYHAGVAAGGIIVAAASSTAIQFWFRALAKRSHFRRRQTASRVATFAEAFSSIAWAATAAVAAAGSAIALFTALIALAILAGTRFLSPHKAPGLQTSG